MTQATITKKMLVKDIMRVIILEEFKKMLRNEKGIEDCKKVLHAINDLSEKTKTDLRIFLKEEKYADELLEIRLKFLHSFELETLIMRVNDELIAVGNSALQGDEANYIIQCVLDPCRDKMMGPVGQAYQQHITVTYADELAEIEKQNQTEMEILQKTMMDPSKMGNPFKNKYESMCTLAKRSPALFSARLRVLEKKIEIFEKLAEFMRNEIITVENPNQIAGLGLLLEAMTDIVYKTEGLNIDNDNVQVICEKILQDNALQESLNKELETKIEIEGFDEIPGLLDSIYAHYKNASTQSERKNRMK